MADEPEDPAPDPMAQLSERAQDYANLWRSAIERNAAGTYKPEDWFDDVNKAWAMAAEDAARTFAVVVDAVRARTSDDEDGPSANG